MKTFEYTIFKRNVPKTTEIFKKSTVGIAGCGGLGSNIAISLVRAGIGKLVLTDFDIVEPSNLNRQHFFQTDIGKEKVYALAEYLKNINPKVELELHNKKLIKEDIKNIYKNVDIMVEAFDKAESKAWLIESWCINFPKKEIVCASGISGIGNIDKMIVKKTGKIYFIGDGKTDMSEGLNSSKVTIAANMQASTVMEILLDKTESRISNHES